MNHPKSHQMRPPLIFSPYLREEDRVAKIKFRAHLFGHLCKRANVMNVNDVHTIVAFSQQLGKSMLDNGDQNLLVVWDALIMRRLLPSAEMHHVTLTGVQDF